jgi:hypothetical protein
MARCPFIVLKVDMNMKYTLSQIGATQRHVRKKQKWYSMELNMALFSQPYFRAKLVSEITGTKYMHQLVKLKILSVREEGREVYYVYDDLLRILQA